VSISSALAGALSGLTAASRAAETVSANIANARTEGYAPRELQLSAQRIGLTGQGVQVDGVSRKVDTILLRDRRMAEADTAKTSALAGFWAGLERDYGSPTDPMSLSGRITRFDSALLTAISSPESSASLNAVADTAQQLVEMFGKVGAQIQTARMTADRQIATQVNDVNRAVAAVAKLNTNIVAVSSGGRDASALQDERQRLIDSIAGILPIKEIAQKDGRVALYTSNGGVLLDGQAFKLAFQPTGLITPEMTMGSGALSGITLNGQALRLDSAGPLGGGALAAQITLRDEIAPQAQDDLDSLARDLIERFSAPTVDPTLSPGMPGLFTDAGQNLDPANLAGLAQRLRLNAAADPDQGGAVWRLRDGLGATTPGPSGASDQISSLQTALTQMMPNSFGAVLPGNRSFAGLASQVGSAVSSARLTAETEASFSQSRLSALQTLERAGGVDSDSELQDLMLIEQAYAANAKVIETVDRLIQRLMEI
jgi:flagellar hook-associated protein 1